MSSIISVNDLCLWYGQTRALKNINMEIPEKSITALIGPSGCGKSTFLKTLDRMNDLVPDVKITGEVKYKEKNIYAPGTDVNELRRCIGMVFQKPNPFPMSIYDNVAYGPRTHGVRKKSELDEIVERSLQGAAIWDEVKDRLKKSALGLSGGQQQRVSIARAIITEPSIVLADEPTGNLDSRTGQEVMELLCEIFRERNTTFILSSHDPQMQRYTDRTVYFSDGKIEIENHHAGEENAQ
jgi:phosphate transport system ATP-binding protein